MTEAARRVLSDCELAVAELTATNDSALWRRRWAAALALLRSVGHVLDKVDAARGASHRRAIDAWWKMMGQSKPQPAIFWSFIEDERNSILKEYKSRGVHTTQTTIRFEMATGARTDPPPIYSTVIEGGPFDGCSQIDIGREAVHWWQKQLDEIDAQVREAP